MRRGDKHKLILGGHSRAVCCDCERIWSKAFKEVDIQYPIHVSNQRGLLWVVCSGGSTDAFLQMELERNRLVVDHMAVAQHKRGQGLGFLLMKAAIDYARKQNIGNFHLSAATDEARETFERIFDRLGLSGNWEGKLCDKYPFYAQIPPVPAITENALPCAETLAIV